MTAPFDLTRIASARQLIADSEARLMKAEKVFAEDRLAVCELNEVRSMLRRVRHWKDDSDEVVTLALGFLGPNGWLPLIDRLCALASDQSPIRLNSLGRAA